MGRVQRIDFREKFINFLADFGIYSFAVIGVLISRYLPQFRAHGFIDLNHITLGTLIPSCVIAFMISFGMDFDSDTEGARRNWKRRAAFALTNGAMWQTIIGG